MGKWELQSAHIARLRAQGLSLRAIGRQFGVSEGSIRRMLNVCVINVVSETPLSASNLAGVFIAFVASERFVIYAPEGSVSIVRQALSRRAQSKSREVGKIEQALGQKAAESLTNGTKGLLQGSQQDLNPTRPAS
jgi:hypothetical protein